MARNLLPEIEDSPRVDVVRIWGLGGSGFVVRSGDDVVYIDPWLVPPGPERTTHRVYPPPFPPDAVRRALAVLSTHAHEDHCNTETLLGINRSTGARFAGPRSSVGKALAAGYPPSRVVTLHPGDRHELSPAFTVRSFGARDPYEDSALMYLIETPRGNILHSGDTSYFEGFREIGEAFRVDVALLNFGKQIPTPEKPYYMDADRLASAATDLRARVVVPMHWNLWVETREDPLPIAAILRSRSPDSKLVILEGGEKLEL